MSRICYLIFIVGFISACSKPTQTIPRVDTTELFKAPKRVIEEAYTNVQKSPHSDESWGEYGMTLHAHEFHDAAAKCYLIASEINTNTAKWKYLRAHLVQVSDPELAWSLLDELTKQKATQTHLYLFRKAQVAQRLGSEKLAIEIYQQVLDSSEYSDYSRIELARRQFQIGNYDQTKVVLNGMSLAGRNTAEYSKLLGQLLTRSGEAQKGRELIESSKKQPSIQTQIVDPYLASVQRLRRDPFYLASRYSKATMSGDTFALKRLSRLLDAHPQLVDVRVKYVSCLLHFQRFREADSELEKGLETSPGDIDLLRMQSASMIMQKKWILAEEILVRLLKLQPNSDGAIQDLGYVQSRVQE